MDERLIVQSENGLQSNPRAGPAGVVFVYERPPTTVANASYFELIDAGAVTIRVTAYAMEAFDEARLGGEPVIVRGRAGRHAEVTRPSSNVDWRTVRWVEVTENRKLVWEIGAHPRTLSREQLVSFADALSPTG